MGSFLFIEYTTPPRCERQVFSQEFSENPPPSTPSKKQNKSIFSLAFSLDLCYTMPMTANKEHQSANYNRSVTWDDSRKVKFNDHMEVEGFTKVTDVWPSESSIAMNREQRKALGGGKSYGYRYKSMQRQDWYVDFDAKAFWAVDNV